MSGDRMENRIPLLSLPLFLIALGFMFLTTLTSSADEVGCTPDKAHNNDTFVGCPNLEKTGKWFVFWPDGDSTELILYGSGQRLGSVCDRLSAICD